MKRNVEGGLWLLGLLLALGLMAFALLPRSAPNPFSVTDLQKAVQSHKIESLYLEYEGDTVKVSGTFKGGQTFETRTLSADPLLSQSALAAQGVTVTIAEGGGASWIGTLSTVLSVLLLVALIALLLRGRGAGGGLLGGGGPGDAALSFGKAKANIIQEGQVKVTFADVAGCDEAKQDLSEVVDFLRFPDKYHALGARIPHGTLLVGPPGSGKTLLARAVAGEAKVPFFALSGSDFVEMFVGVGAARVRDLFDQARKVAPCIVFIDEIDAVGRKRGSGMQGNDEREQTLNQLLVEMDGFGSAAESSTQSTSGDIIILAATNRPDVLDAALLRPGRFDRQVTVDAPDVKGREQILKIHARKKPLDVGVDLTNLARQTTGMVGADLENVLNEAALGAARASRSKITAQDIEGARDRVLMGPERRSMVIAEHDRRVTAYHEVGHALAAQLLPYAERVHKLTVVPRGRALGAAMYTPQERMHHTEAALLDRIAVALAGHAAEEVVLGEVTTGAQNDFEQATNLARRMVTEWGMSRLGQVALHAGQADGLGGRGQYSEQTANLIDREVARITAEQYQRVRELLQEHLYQIHRLTDALVEREVLDASEFVTVLTGKPLPPLPVAQPSSGQVQGKLQTDTV